MYICKSSFDPCQPTRQGWKPMSGDLQSSDVGEVKDQGWTHCHTKLLRKRSGDLRSWMILDNLACLDINVCRFQKYHRPLCMENENLLALFNWIVFACCEIVLRQHAGQRDAGKTLSTRVASAGTNRLRKRTTGNVKIKPVRPRLSIPASMNGLSTSNSPSSAWVVQFFRRPAPPHLAASSVSVQAEANAIASCTSFMTVFLHVKGTASKTLAGSDKGVLMRCIPRSLQNEKSTQILHLLNAWSIHTYPKKAKRKAQQTAATAARSNRDSKPCLTTTGSKPETFQSSRAATTISTSDIISWWHAYSFAASNESNM